MTPQTVPGQPPHLIRPARRFFASPEQFQGTEVVLSPAESHHILRVLRLPRGERLEVGDGRGRIFLAEIAALEGAGVRLRLLEEVASAVESPLRLTLGLALVRAETFEAIIRQATEMGVWRLEPFYSRRSLIRPEAWVQTKHSRWQRLAQEAMKSSQRPVVPEISLPVEFGQVLQGPEEMKVLFWEEQRDHCPGVALGGKSVASARVLIGPEGGFTDEEAAAARQAGFLVMGLGPRRLRVETAALAAVTVVQYLWGDLGR